MQDSTLSHAIQLVSPFECKINSECMWHSRRAYNAAKSAFCLRQIMHFVNSKFGIGNFIYAIWDQLVWDHIVLKYQKSWLVADMLPCYHARQIPVGGAREPGLTFAKIRDESVETLLYLKWPLFGIVDISIPSPYIPQPTSPKITVVFLLL